MFFAYYFWLTTITGMKTWKLYQHYDGLILYIKNIYEKCLKVALHRWTFLIFFKIWHPNKDNVKQTIPTKALKSHLSGIIDCASIAVMFNIVRFKLSLFGYHILTKSKMLIYIKQLLDIFHACCLYIKLSHHNVDIVFMFSFQ